MTLVVAGIVITIFGAVGAVITQWAWNTLVFGLFNGPEINFWQALAVNILMSVVWRARSK